MFARTCGDGDVFAVGVCGVLVAAESLFRSCNPAPLCAALYAVAKGHAQLGARKKCESPGEVQWSGARGSFSESAELC